VKKLYQRPEFEVCTPKDYCSMKLDIARLHMNQKMGDETATYVWTMVLPSPH
jgi:hypothetical protein